MLCIVLNTQQKLFYTDVNVHLQLSKWDTATRQLKQAGSGLFAEGWFGIFKIVPLRGTATKLCACVVQGGAPPHQNPHPKPC